MHRLDSHLVLAHRDQTAVIWLHNHLFCQDNMLLNNTNEIKYHTKTFELKQISIF